MRSRAAERRQIHSLGREPQAKNMPRLRRSNQGVTPEGLHGDSTSGANLFRDETTSCILHLGSWILYLAGRVESAGQHPPVDGDDSARHPRRGVGEQE